MAESCVISPYAAKAAYTNDNGMSMYAMVLNKPMSVSTLKNTNVVYAPIPAMYGSAYSLLSAGNITIRTAAMMTTEGPRFNPNVSGVCVSYMIHPECMAASVNMMMVINAVTNNISAELNPLRYPIIERLVTPVNTTPNGDRNSTET